jgi:hypothetical protein
VLGNLSSFNRGGGAPRIADVAAAEVQTEEAFDDAVLARLAAAEQRLSEAEQSGLEQVAAARRLEVEKEELAEKLAAAQLAVAGLEAQLEVARNELEEKVLKLGTKIQVRYRPNFPLYVTVSLIATNPYFTFNLYRDQYHSLL